MERMGFVRIITKLFKHTPVFSFFLVCLLTVGVAFSSIGFSFYQSARQQQKEINAGYTTAAIPYNEEAHGYMPFASGEASWQTVSMEELLQGAPVDYKLDRRIYLGAVAEGMSSWTPAANMMKYSLEKDTPYASSVFAVQCEDVQTEESESYVESYDADGNFLGSETINDCWYIYEFSVLETLCFMDRGISMPEYGDPETGNFRSSALPPEAFRVWTKIVNQDGTPIFEVGKTYLIRGDCPVNDSGTPRGYFDLRNGAAFAGVVEMNADENGFGGDKVVSEDILPLYTEFTGSVDEFLDSEEGTFWRDTVIPAVEQNYYSVKMMLTDNVNSMYWFNTGEASILEGRNFTGDEYKTGQDVCLVSASYAEQNGLTVGDMLTLELFNPYFSVWSATGEDDLAYLQMDPCMPENSLGIQKEYTIVGIYTAPAFAEGTYAFGADTVFAPKASVPGAEEFENRGAYIPLLNSAMIPNGSSEKLDAFLEEKGFGGSLLYFDQGFTEASSAVEALMENALRLFVAGIAFLAVTAGFFLFLSLHKMRPTIVSLRRMGVSGKVCWRDMQIPMTLMVSVAVLLGTALSILLFQRVGSLLLSAELKLPLGAALADMAVKLVILLLLEGFFTWRLTKVGLMQNRKGRKKV